MGYWKERLLEREALCEGCRERPREVGCPVCGEPTICRTCHEGGADHWCGGCRHFAETED
jgi:hypothetical protein